MNIQFSFSDAINDSQTDKTKLLYLIASVFVFLAIFIAFILQRNGKQT